MIKRLFRRLILGFSRVNNTTKVLTPKNKNERWNRIIEAQRGLIE